MHHRVPDEEVGLNTDDRISLSERTAENDSTPIKDLGQASGGLYDAGKCGFLINEHSLTVASQPEPKSCAAPEKYHKEGEDGDEVKGSGPTYKEVSTADLFRFTTLGERVMLIFASLCAMVAGSSWPVWAVLFGDTVNSFDSASSNTTMADDDFKDEMHRIAIIFTIVGIVVGLAQFLSQLLFGIISSRISLRVRLKFLESLISQDATWHDQHETSVLETRLTVNIPKLKKATGDQFGMFFVNLSSCPTALVFAFVMSGDSGWKITLVGLCIVPLIGYGCHVIRAVWERWGM